MESHSVIAFPFKTEIKNQFLQISLTYCLLKLSIIISLVFLATNHKKKKSYNKSKGLLCNAI